jgi:AcrR family transcriptional regulator
MKTKVKTVEKKSTKEQILDAAIDLFSQKGYDAVSIREIARTVGINEASIYNHYKGKEDIMDSIIGFLISEFNREPPKEASEDLLNEQGMDAFVESISMTIMERLKEPRIGKICRLLCIELYRNARVRDFFTKTFIEQSYDIWEQAFRKMMDGGYIEKKDARLLATEFFDPCIFLYLDCFIIRYNEIPYEALIDNTTDRLSRHIKFFFECVRL